MGEVYTNSLKEIVAGYFILKKVEVFASGLHFRLWKQEQNQMTT